MSNHIEIPVESLHYGTSALVRSGFDQQTVDNYAGLWRDYLKDLLRLAKGANAPEYPLPPIKVAIVKDGNKTTYNVVSGQHRGRGAMKAGMETIRAELVSGTDSELLKIAVEDNQKHGKQNSPQDLRQCILAASAAFPALSSRLLAQMIGCSKTHVGNVLNKASEQTKPPKTAITVTVKSLANKEVQKLCGSLSDAVHNITDLDKLTGAALRKLGAKIDGVLTARKRPQREVATVATTSQSSSKSRK